MLLCASPSKANRQAHADSNPTAVLPPDLEVHERGGAGAVQDAVGIDEVGVGREKRLEAIQLAISRLTASAGGREVGRASCPAVPAVLPSLAPAAHTRKTFQSGHYLPAVPLAVWGATWTSSTKPHT